MIRNIKQIAGYFLAGFTIAHAAGLFAVSARDILSSIDSKSSSYSRQIETAYEVPVNGYSWDMKSNGTLTHIEKALAIEQAMGPVNLESITVRSDKKMLMTAEEKSHVEKAEKIGKKNGGYATPDMRIVLAPDASQDTVVHELSHNKHFNLDKETRKELKARWLECANIDAEEGYLDDEWIDSTDEDLEAHGWPTKYSAKSFMEDVAETRTLMMKSFFTPDKEQTDSTYLDNSCRGKKLVDAGLLKEETPKYANVQWRHSRIKTLEEEAIATGLFRELYSGTVETYLERSSEFLEDYPHSPHMGHLRLQRSHIFASQGDIASQTAELKSILKDSPFKVGAYEEAIEDLYLLQPDLLDHENPIVRARQKYLNAESLEIIGRYEYGVDHILAGAFTPRLLSSAEFQ